MRLILCAGIRPPVGTENLIPEEVNYTKITIRMTVMNKVQFLLASEPRKQRWSRFPEQNGGLAKVDSGLDYAANFSSPACVA
jgi:hypothetical protein